MIMDRKHVRFSIWSIITMACALFFGFSPAAYAHDVVIASNPENGSVVESFPHSYELEFSGEPQPSFNTVALSNTDTGDVLFTGTPELDGRFIRFSIPEDINPGAGNYTIGFQITSSDGHATRGKLEFAVGGSQQENNAQENSVQENNSTVESTTTNDESQGTTIIIGVIIAVLILAAVILMVKFNRK